MCPLFAYGFLHLFSQFVSPMVFIQNLDFLNSQENTIAIHMQLVSMPLNPSLVQLL
jgi:hypothetical protein